MKNNNYVRIILSILSLVCTFAIYGQNATLSGKISTDAGEPLGAASIALEGTTLGAISDENGNFTIDRIPAGTYLVKAIYSPYLSAFRRSV